VCVCVCVCVCDDDDDDEVNTVSCLPCSVGSVAVAPQISTAYPLS
jgi:hypothetical protein